MTYSGEIYVRYTNPPPALGRTCLVSLIMSHVVTFCQETKDLGIFCECQGQAFFDCLLHSCLLNQLETDFWAWNYEVFRQGWRRVESMATHHVTVSLKVRSQKTLSEYIGKHVERTVHESDGTVSKTISEGVYTVVNVIITVI
jgi:hypothetical protein